MLTDVEILKLAKNNLIDEKTKYLCYAIRLIGLNDRQYLAQCHRIEEWVTKMIFPYATVDKWLYSTVGKYLIDYNCIWEPSEEGMRAYRIEWADKLIAICQEEKND